MLLLSSVYFSINVVFFLLLFLPHGFVFNKLYKHNLKQWDTQKKNTDLNLDFEIFWLKNKRVCD